MVLQRKKTYGEHQDKIDSQIEKSVEKQIKPLYAVHVTNMEDIMENQQWQTECEVTQTLTTILNNNS